MGNLQSAQQSLNAAMQDPLGVIGVVAIVVYLTVLIMPLYSIGFPVDAESYNLNRLFLLWPVWPLLAIPYINSWAKSGRACSDKTRQGGMDG